MEILAILLGFALLLAIGFLIWKFKEFQNVQNPDKQRQDLEQQKLEIFNYIEALRKELREAGTENRKETQSKLDQVRKESEEKLDKMQERLAKGLENSSQTIQKQFSQSAKLISEVTERLTKLDETNKQVLGFSEKMQSLENILKNPKQRGILGEYFLETLLSHVLAPTQYKVQYQFQNGEIVDAVVFFKDKVIPIDAKFSLEKYNKIMEEQDAEVRKRLKREFKMDIKNRIDETAKYIRPNEDTTDFAFMFIPAEGIYYNLLMYKVGGSVDVNSKDLIEYAFAKHVIIVSPTSFYAYLETVLQGLKALKMEESIKDIVKKVRDLNRHLNSYEDYYQKIGKHLGTTVSMYNKGYREFKKIDKDVYKITSGDSGGSVDPLVLDKPQEEE